MTTIATLADTLLELAKPGMKPKALLAAVRERHPESTKKEVVRAAFYALAENHPLGTEQAKELHGFAIGERNADEAAPIKRGRLRTRKTVKAASEAATA